MTMTTTRKRRAPKVSSDTVTVTVVEPHLVYFDGEQRSGVLTDVPADTAAHWEHHGWATITDPPAPAKPGPDGEK
jgi:hypothetical protein